MKITGNEIRPSNVLQHNRELWLVVKLQHVKPGKGGAFVQVELKNLSNGSKLNERFRSADKVERVRLEQTDYQYLYESDGVLTFMNTATYDQIELQADFIGARKAFLQEGMLIVVESYEEKPLGIRLPDHVTLEVYETEPVVKGQTAASSNKPAICENQIRVMVPPFIATGDKIIVDTNEVIYLKRAD